MSDPRFSAEHYKNNLPPGVDPWLPPKAVAAALGVTEKWLASAREGRKNVVGPPYVKLGEGRSAHVRYKLSSLLEWMDRFEEHAGTILQRSVTPYATEKEFLARAGEKDKWLYAIDRNADDTLNFFSLIASAANWTTEREFRYIDFRWLTKTELDFKQFRRVQLKLSADTLRKLIRRGSGNPALGIELLMLADESHGTAAVTED